jgi:hypothetical protein
MPDEDPKLAVELSKMQHEELLDIEKKLIAGSLVMGAALLLLLGLISWAVGPRL